MFLTHCATGRRNRENTVLWSRAGAATTPPKNQLSHSSQGTHTCPFSLPVALDLVACKISLKILKFWKNSSPWLSLGRHQMLARKIQKWSWPFTRLTFGYPIVTINSLLMCSDLAETDASLPGHASGMDEGQAQVKGEHPRKEPLAGSVTLRLGCPPAEQCMRQARPEQRDKCPAFSS